jgi:hypothetical protein
VDDNSGISSYAYAIGTTPGDSDFVGWTTLQGLDFTLNATLVDWQTYYVSVYSINGAGLRNSTVSTDGQLIIFPVGINEEKHQLLVTPTTFNTNFSIGSNKHFKGAVQVYSLEGKLMLKENIIIEAGATKVFTQLSKIPAGIYLLHIWNEHTNETIKLIKN